MSRTASTKERPVWRAPGMSKGLFAFLAEDALAEEQLVHFRRSAPVDLLQHALNENLTLRGKVEVLEAQMAELLSRLGLTDVETRDISKAQAAQEIRVFFRENDGSEIYPDEIAEALNLDLMQVIEICEDLENAGKISSQA